MNHLAKYFNLKSQVISRRVLGIIKLEFRLDYKRPLGGIALNSNRWERGLVIAGALLIMIWGLTTVTVSAKTGTAVGDQAPRFTLQGLDGRNYDLAKVVASNKVTLVNFWATWCPPCRAEIPELVQFYNKYRGKGVTLLAVNMKQDAATIKPMATQLKMNFPILLDKDGTVGDHYQVYYIPSTYILDRTGTIRDRIDGGTNLATLESKVDALLKGR